jgi:hypothetical protein
MTSRAVANFMKQQGFAEEPPDACDMHFEGLYFQPRLVFPTVIVAILLQLVSVPLSAVLHFLISAVLWWNTLLPALNPLELAYNRWVARPNGRLPLGPAPGPRRMAQGMAAAFNLGAGLALVYRMDPLAWALQAMLVVAFSALLFGRFCLGAYVYHLLKGRVAFANSTLPWARG